MIRREEDGGYYQYFLDFPDSPSLRLSSIPADKNRFYSELPASARARPQVVLVYPRANDEGLVSAVALGGLYHALPDVSATHLPTDLQLDTGYFTGKFLGAAENGFGSFKIAQKGSPNLMETPLMDISQVTDRLQPNHWVDLRFVLEPWEEQYKLVVREVCLQEANGTVSGWNDPFYSEPEPEPEVPVVAVEPEPQRKRWQKAVERPVKKGRFKYEVR